MLDLASRGPVEVDDLPHATGHEAHVLFVERRATAFEWRSRVSTAEIERALNAPATVNRAVITARKGGQDLRKKSAVPRATNGAAAQAELDRLLQLHGRDLREHLAETNEAVWPALRVYSRPTHGEIPTSRNRE